MKFVKTTSFPSETASLKAENRLLWILLVIANMVIAFQMYEHDRIISSVIPQAVIDACNSAKEAQ